MTQAEQAAAGRTGRVLDTLRRWFAATVKFEDAMYLSEHELRDQRMTRLESQVAQLRLDFIRSQPVADRSESKGDEFYRTGNARIGY